MMIGLPLVSWLPLQQLHGLDTRDFSKVQTDETVNFLSAPLLPPLWRAISEKGLVRILYYESQIFLNHLDVAYKTGKAVFDHISKYDVFIIWQG